MLVHPGVRRRLSKATDSDWSIVDVNVVELVDSLGGTLGTSEENVYDASAGSSRSIGEL